MKFRFPVVIIDEDFRSENASGLGIRALARALEAEGFEVLGVTSYGDLSELRPAAEPRVGVHPVDRRRGVRIRLAGRDPRGAREPARVRRGDPLPQHRDPGVPARRDADFAPHPERHPPAAERLHPHERGHARVRRALHRARGADLPRQPRAAVLPRARALRERRQLFVALPRPLRRRRVPEEPGRADVPPVLRREPAARRRLQLGRRAGPAARPLGAGRGLRAQRRAHLQRRRAVLRHQRHVVVEQDGVARDGGAGRHRRRRPQLPQVDPARDHDDRRRSGVPDADAQPSRHHRPDLAATSSAGRTSRRRSARTRSRRT